MFHLEKNKTDTDSLKKNHKKFLRNNKSILKTQQRFKIERHNFFTEEINKIVLSSNDDKRMQSVDSIERYPYGTSKDLVSEKGADVTKENIKEHNPNWPQIPDHPYRILIIGCSGSGKTNSLFSLINHQPDIDKIYLYAKGPYKAKYQFLIKKREDVGAKYFNDSEDFIEYSNNMDDI